MLDPRPDTIDCSKRIAWVQRSRAHRPHPSRDSAHNPCARQVSCCHASAERSVSRAGCVDGGCPQCGVAPRKERGQLRCGVRSSWIAMGRRRVRDHGAAIDEAMHRVFFTPGLTTKDRETGFGMVVARSTSERHGGRLELASLPSSCVPNGVLNGEQKSGATRECQWTMGGNVAAIALPRMDGMRCRNDCPRGRLLQGRS